jgi:hypothetical protein
MTTNTIEKISGKGCQKNLFNMGAPRSRARSENIKSSIFDAHDLRAQHEMHALDIPSYVTDLEEWVRSLYKPKLFSNWGDIALELALPSVSMLVVPTDSPTNINIISRFDMLRTAVILSKCNANRYVPDAPMIFTRNRLERKVELIKINLNSYYELD